MARRPAGDRRVLPALPESMRRERERVESVVARAEAAVEAHDYGEAIDLLAEVKGRCPRPRRRISSCERCSRSPGRACTSVRCARRCRCSRGPERSSRVGLLGRRPGGGPLPPRLLPLPPHLGVHGAGAFTEALELAERSGIPCDRLRSRIFGWRSRCYRRQRDWEAARRRCRAGAGAGEALDDPRGTADAYFLGALVAERRGQWVAARAYAEKARALYEQIEDRANTGKLLTTLGVLTFLLGSPTSRFRSSSKPLRSLWRSGATPTRRRPSRRSRRCTCAPARSSWPSSRLRTPSSCSAIGWTSSMRSETPSSSSAARCSSRAGSTRRRRSSCRGGELRAAVLGEPQGGRLDGAGRARGRARRQGDRDHLYQRAVEALQDFRF